MFSLHFHGTISFFYCTVQYLLLRYTTVRYSSAIEKMIKTVQIEYGLDVSLSVFEFETTIQYACNTLIYSTVCTYCI